MARSSNKLDGTENIIPVLSSQKLEIFPDLYAKAAMVMPMNVVMYPGHAGVSSLSMFVDFEDALSGKLLVRIQGQRVMINTITRKPVSLPKAYSGYDGPSPDAPVDPVVVPRLRQSPNAVTYTFRVNHSDSDQWYHTNQATYFRLCSDAAANACNDGKLKNFSGDFFHYDVSGALIRYLGESFPGDDLEVTVWEDHVEFDSLYFHISRLNKPIFAAKFTYFKPTVSKI